MKKNNDNLEKMRHSASHLLAGAVVNLYPDTKLGIGPTIENGFYYDFKFDKPISDEDLPKIEKEMRRLQKEWTTFEKIEKSSKEAKEIEKTQPFKLELIEDLSKENQQIIFYKSGNFIDLCKGPHVQDAKEIGPFKLLSVAGAYWKGSEKNEMLTRIYGTCFPTQKELDEHLKMLEEAKKRDHRKLGKELDIFFIDDLVGKGLVMWLPKGNIIKDEIEKFVKETEKKEGYIRVTTPHIAKEELYLKSGHLPYYKDSMFPGMKMDDGVYYLKAMNCPHHHRIYQHKIRSYKELPLRIAEYGTVYRSELSGTLAGLLRVRGMDMNDAHIYARRDQIKEEFQRVLEMTINYFKVFGFKDYWFRLSKWSPDHPEKYINEPENWNYSQGVIKETLDEMKVQYEEIDNEAAFYGPKVDIQFKSVTGREESMSTVQLDFLAKERFDLFYIDKEGKENNNVFVIHRAPLSVHERFMAFLLEHYAGAFPTWLSPVQVKIIPIADRHKEGAEKIAKELKEHNVRVELDDRSESMQSKIREATLQKVPYMGIIGDKELAGNSKLISVRTREGKDLGELDFSNFLEKLLDEIDKKA